MNTRKHKDGNQTYKYKTLSFGKVSDLTISQDIENRIYKSIEIQINFGISNKI